MTLPDAFYSGHELVLRDRIHEIDLGQVLSRRRGRALVHRVHSQKARLTGGMRLPALPNAHLRPSRLRHRQTAARVRHALAEMVQMTVGKPRQTLEPRIAQHLVLTLHHAPRNRSAHAAQGLVHLRQQTDVRLRVPPGERTLGIPPTILDVPRGPAPRNQSRRLTATEPCDPDQKFAARDLVGPRQTHVPRTQQNPTREAVRIGRPHESELDPRPAGHEVADLVQGLKPFDIEL